MNFDQRLKELELRIKTLEEENIETTNVLYEILNTLDSQSIDNEYINQKWGLDKHEF